MTARPTGGVPMDADMLNDYFRALVNRFFKILPMKEADEDTLGVYMESLQSELLGCKELITGIHNDGRFLSLVAILEFLIDNPTCSLKAVRREVFRAISICNQLKAIYGAK